MISLKDVSNRLLEIGYPIQGSLISFFSQADDCYVFVRKEPIKEEDLIPIHELYENRLHLKFRFPDQLIYESTVGPSAIS
jgi:hypothetical protein